jgi:hypothetical protein
MEVKIFWIRLVLDEDKSMASNFLQVRVIRGMPIPKFPGSLAMKRFSGSFYMKMGSCNIKFIPEICR